DVVVGRDVQAVETTAARIEGRKLGVGVDLVYEYVAVVSGEDKVVAVKADVGLAFAADARVLAEGVHHVYGAGRSVVALELVPAHVVKRGGVRPRPPRFGRGVDLEWQSPDVSTGAIVKREVTLMH